MQTSYFNSYLESHIYLKLKVEAVELKTPVRDHISNLLKEYILTKYPEIKETKDERD